MDTAYAFVVDLPRPLPEAVAALRTALQAEQLGIVSELDVAELLRQRLGVDVPPQRLLGVCSAETAWTLRGTEPELAALLPCGCSVAELAPGRSRIALQDPRVLALVSAQRAVRAACERDRAVIKRVADRLHALAGD